MNFSYVLGLGVLHSYYAFSTLAVWIFNRDKATVRVCPSVRPSVHRYVYNTFAFQLSRSDICRLYSLAKKFLQMIKNKAHKANDTSSCFVERLYGGMIFVMRYLSSLSIFPKFNKHVISQMADGRTNGTTDRPTALEGTQKEGRDYGKSTGHGHEQKE